MKASREVAYKNAPEGFPDAQPLIAIIQVSLVPQRRPPLLESLG